MAAGLEVRKPRDGVASANDGGGVVSEFGWTAGERIEWSWRIVAALFAWVFRRARFSLRVSWTLRRRARIDSGVGVLVGRGSVRPCCVAVSINATIACVCGSDERSRQGLRKVIYLIMPQSHPRCQLIWDRQDIPERVDLEFVECLVHGCLKQRF